MAYKFKRQGYKFQGLEGVDPYLLPYVKDALQWNYDLQWDIYENIKGAYEQFILPIVIYLKNQKREFKGVDKRVERILMLSKMRLSKDLHLIVYEALKNACFIASSPMARLKLDELISFNLDELNYGQLKDDNSKDDSQDDIKDGNKNNKKATSEIIKASIPIGEETQKNKIKYHLNLVQSFELKHAEAVAKNTIDKKRVFDNKEFKLSSRIWDITDKNLADIKTILRENQNVDCAKIAKMLEKYQRSDYVTTCSQYPSMMKRLNGRVAGSLSFEAFRLARNECAEVAFKQSIERYQENPFVEAVKWLLSNNRNPKYEKLCKCNDIAYEDNYGLGEGIYPKDAVPNRPHVMCLCNIAPITGRQFKKALKEGLKLGNVPADWWLEQKKLLDEVRKNSVEEKQYRLQFKTQNEQKKEYIGEVKKADWFQNGVKDEHKSMFLNDLFNTSEKTLKILAEHTRQMKADLYNNDGYGSRYNPRENKIYCNLWTDRLKPDNKAIGFKLGTKTFLHESGHWLDYNRFKGDGLIRDRMPNLLDNLKNDLINKINKIGPEKINKINENNLINLNKSIKQLITNEIKRNIAINSAVSDIMGAISYEQIAGYTNAKTGHIYSYWQYQDINANIIKAEVIANLFETLGSNIRIGAMVEYFPSTWEYFNNMVERLF